MSELHRLKRIAKSLIPHTPRESEKRYNYSDAKMMINDLALTISPNTLSYLVDSDMVLDDFIHSIYELEHTLHQKATNDLKVIDPELYPRAYEEHHRVVFTVTYDGEEWVFAEYNIP